VTNKLKQENRLRAVVDTAMDGVILIDTFGTILMFNPACELLFGYLASEVVGGNVEVLMPSPLHEEHHRHPSNYRETGERKIIGIRREVAGRRKNGSTFPMDLSVGESRQEDETVFVGIIHDLTERHRQERTLRESAARLNAVVETAVDGVILIDARGLVSVFNPACERLFGYAADEVIGKNVKILMPSPFDEGHDGYLWNFRNTGERKIVGIGRDIVGSRKDGSTFPMDLSLGEAKQDGESIFVGIIHDLSEHKRTEAQLVQAQKMEIVGQLSGGIAHDFNNLLTVIIGNAELLGGKLKTRPDLKQYCETIINAGERGAELTQRLLAFSRKQSLVPISFDCNELVDGMRIILRRTLRENIEVRVNLDPHLLHAYADPAQLESAALNLALNAQDAMPEGGTLSISTEDAVLDQEYQEGHPEVLPGRYVLITVTDNGTGMPPEVRERVFEPFFTTKGVGKGSGLGLSMVYGYMKQSNGHVAVYSEPGLGTSVRLYLPTAKSSAAAPLQEPQIEESAPTGTGIVLVVEDDPFVRGYAVGSLESLGYQVMTAADGPEAMQKLRRYEDQIDVLFTDMVMPGGMGGMELAERAMALLPGLKVLLTSGYPLKSMAAGTQLKPAPQILHKPYRKAELARRMRDLIDS
jgi:PAS domain S-box-containing protein